MFKVGKYIAINGAVIIYRNTYRRQRTACKDNAVRLLCSVRARTANFKMAYVRVVLCTCVRGVHKFFSPDCLKRDSVTESSTVIFSKGLKLYQKETRSSPTTQTDSVTDFFIAIFRKNVKL